MLKPKLFSIIKHRDTELPKEQLVKDVISGIIVAVIALPLSVALAISSGVTPEKGLITAIVAGFIISFFGGSRVQVGGPTGAFVVIIYGIVAEYGMNGLIVATIMAGIAMIIFGIMRFGSIIKYIPYPITTGFTSGIAVTLMTTEVKDFLGLSIKKVPSGFVPQWNSYITHLSTASAATIALGGLSLLIMILWPRINKIIPGSLIALIVATVLAWAFKLPVETIGSRFGNISGRIHLINLGHLGLSYDMVKGLVNPAISIAFLASIESLLSAVVADGMIGKKHNSNMELIAQGAANIASVLLGGIPATGAIARTAANVRNGGRTPIAGIVHAIVLLLIMMVFLPLAKMIPMTALAAILIMVAYNMSEWRSFKSLLKSTRSDIAVLLVTFSLTVLFDLVIAIEVGMVFAMFLFVRRMSESTTVSNMEDYYKAIALDNIDEFDEQSIKAQKKLQQNLGSKVLLYEINGPLFFGVTNTFLEVMNELKDHSRVLILNMRDVPNMDASAMNAIKRIDKRCHERKIKLLYAQVNEQPMKVMLSSGYVDKIGDNSFFEETDEAIRYANSLLANGKTKTVNG